MGNRSWLAAVSGAAIGAVAARAAYSAFRRRPPVGEEKTWTRTNHRGEPITLLEGPAYVAATGAAAAVTPGLPLRVRAAALLAGVGSGFLGGYDDIYGTTASKGFKGHLAALARREVTSGAVKIVGIGAVGLASAALAGRQSVIPSGAGAAAGRQSMIPLGAIAVAGRQGTISSGAMAAAGRQGTVFPGTIAATGGQSAIPSSRIATSLVGQGTNPSRAGAEISGFGATFVDPARGLSAGSRVVDLFIDGAIIAGSANLANLFDLRPGRAIKVGLLAGAPLLAASLYGSRPATAALAAIPLGAAVALLPEDLAERAMLGDAGANSMGALLGLAASVRLSRKARLGVLGVVVGLTAASEKVSFTKVIANNPVLHRIDMIGRRPVPPPAHR
ncbi:hypothetical protein Aple_101290 [Acrocarpospora pleiomorpha]|uniref:Uncharacterized protein n=1 Tax=Acrocarpospora pleiomorpha TaxID=90975 RepID=A0A5M3Y472_9ACTN|nr:hypothetical protein [Acrocarpospora pleiomorpha]GES27229.1 hypothetical protein Aple_101290 [Acrocarpospora pleiomorpha]